MNTRPTNAGGEVAPPDGYTADTGQMSSAVRNISNAAEDAKGEVDEIQHTELTGADFGVKHTQKHADYAAAIERIGKGATEMCDNLSAFASEIGVAGKTYSDTEADVANTVTAPRGRQ